jgi:hypothetical protein
MGCAKDSHWSALQFYRLKEAAEEAVATANEAQEEDRLPPKEVMPVTSLNDESTLIKLTKNRGIVYYSTRTNEPLCDAAGICRTTQRCVLTTEVGLAMVPHELVVLELQPRSLSV